jgi:release factor glutamine methyltransferase
MSASQRTPPTVGEALAISTSRLREAGSETARLDAEVLLGHVLGVDRSTLAAHPEARLGSGQAESFERSVQRRARGEPVAYIRGLKEFFGAAIVVDERVLIPRPETETLVELAISRARADLTSRPRPEGAGPYLVWDVGTGSGAVAVAIALELRRRRYGDAVRFILSDISPDALALATVNAVAHGLADLFTFVPGDLTDVDPAPSSVDLLVANLPYIPSSRMADLPRAAAFEPRLALDGGPDGLGVIRRLLGQVAGAVSPGGAVLLEIGGDQAAALTEAAVTHVPGWTCRIHADLGGSPRVAELERARG